VTGDDGADTLVGRQRPPRGGARRQIAGSDGDDVLARVTARPATGDAGAGVIDGGTTTTASGASDDTLTGGAGRSTRRGSS
jgi:hypothetical protein